MAPAKVEMKPLSLIVVAAILGAAGAAKAADDGEMRLRMKVETCIRTNAPDAERFGANMVDAANFLIDYICVDEIARFEKYQQNSRMIANEQAWSPSAQLGDDEATEHFPTELRKRLADQAAQMRAAYAKAHVDPDTGDLVLPKDAPATVANFGIVVNVASADTPSDFRALAGRSLLEARKARLSAQEAR